MKEYLTRKRGDFFFFFFFFFFLHDKNHYLRDEIGVDNYNEFLEISIDEKVILNN